MDFLKAEIAAQKRKAPSPDTNAEVSVSPRGAEASGSSSKYIRRGEEEAKRREEEQQERRQAAERQARIEQLKEQERQQGERAQSRPKSATPDQEAPASSREVFNISSTEAIRRLRSKGEPIRLFGENDKERRLRLRALELIEERGEKVGQNDFIRALQGTESKMLSEQLEGRKSGPNGKNRTRGQEGDGAAEGTTEAEREGESGSSEKREGVGMNSVLDLGLIKRDINKMYPILYYTLKGLMQDWERMLAERPIEVRQSSQGKLVAATQIQAAEYMRPLFKLLRKRDVKPDILARLAEIVHYVQKREYRKANDAYLQLSIGNSTWPIGVTMVGIHERSGREKIFSSNVAHVLNDEVSRKYIQSLKRLMTFAQTRYPPKDVSMLMG